MVRRPPPPTTLRISHKRGFSRNSSPTLDRLWLLFSSTSSSSCNSYTSFDENNDNELLALVTPFLTNMPEGVVGNPSNHQTHIILILPSTNPLNHSVNTKKNLAYLQVKYNFPPLPTYLLKTVPQGIGSAFFGMNWKYDAVHPYLHQ